MPRCAIATLPRPAADSRPDRSRPGGEDKAGAGVGGIGDSAGVRDNAACSRSAGSLREARLKRNLTPAEVQKAIRIRDRYLQALEEERWELLPGDAYVKGFLRRADYLGLDGNLYIEEYNGRFARPDEPQLVPEQFARSGTHFGGVGFLAR